MAGRCGRPRTGHPAQCTEFYKIENEREINIAEVINKAVRVHVHSKRIDHIDIDTAI